MKSNTATTPGGIQLSLSHFQQSNIEHPRYLSPDNLHEIDENYDINIFYVSELLDDEDVKHAIDIQYYITQNIKRIAFDASWAGNLAVEKIIESSLPVDYIFRRQDCTVLHFHNKAECSPDDEYEIISMK